MKLSPLDVQHSEFAGGLNGYNRKQVKDFLAKIASQLEDMIRDNQNLREEIAKRERRIEELQVAESELKRTVIAAERIGNEIKQNAKREAEIMIKQAELMRDNMIRDGEMRMKEIRYDLARLEKEHQIFREQFRGMLHAFERSLDTIPPPTVRKANPTNSGTVTNPGVHTNPAANTNPGLATNSGVIATPNREREKVESGD
ncbi:MAG: DivIVA domain-containing protein [Trueperaceae bacterium]